ncbi:hypothetical protein G6F57_010569 [Rhizopus arrhizus]|nr:hypothetical protein G6F30_010198 [Rhizopus arrhizus]KAG1404639.1 hypothetical protein G6F58_010164 [Rhizopus delemar]KAG0983695.1 hypothetical protein G6F29_005335 [Rhizopus arrhizus]KAG0987075.1 hypothetical protein G6F28_010096 [Rhizopus arrhizus]KAG1004023.1 hypothetical protein G6F27_010523 [Rhizopus arrhizus]
MPYIQHDRHQQWYKLSKFSLWKIILPPVEELNIKIFKAIRIQFLQQVLDYQKQRKNSKLTSCCRPTVSLDPDLWLSMTRKNVADAKDGALDGCLEAGPCLVPSTQTRR